MKKKLLSLILFITCCLSNANAQVMLGGTAGFSYKYDVFSAAILPTAGYQLNDKWAFGAEFGLEYSDDTSCWVIDPFVRRNIWNNNKFFLDVKAECAMVSNDYETNFGIGLTPSVRMKLDNHWQLSGDFGFFGVTETNDYWKPAAGLSATGVYVSLIYVF